MPRRRCAGCGRIAAKPELLRLAIAADGARPLAVIDRARTMPGRGAYVCAGEDGAPRASCVELGVRRNAFARTLRAPVALDPEIVESVSR